MIHGQPERAIKVVTDIEHSVAPDGLQQDKAPLPKIKLKMRTHTPLREVADTLFGVYRSRSLVGLALMTAQAFFYNAIFFTYALVLTDFFGISSEHVGWYILPFAAGNFLGPVILGPLFDTLGRRKMIALTYSMSGLLLAISGYLFSIGVLSAQTQTIAWMIIFFFASSGGERGLFDRERNVSAGGACSGNCLVLRYRHWCRRCNRAFTVRHVDRYRFAHQRIRWLSARIGSYACRGCCRMAVWDRCRAKISRRRSAALGCAGVIDE